MEHLAKNWLVAVSVAALSTVALRAQNGRVFLPTEDTTAIYEFNSFPGLNLGDVLPEGTVISDLSGNNLHAAVEGNGTGDLTVGAGSPEHDDPPGSNLEVRRGLDGASGGSHLPVVAVNDDGGAFEMEYQDDFSLELYVHREAMAPAANWGILAGTWHSRNDPTEGDTIGDQNQQFWYGYGLIRYAEGGNAGVDVDCNPEECDPQTGAWLWVLSPTVNASADDPGGEVFPGLNEVKIDPPFAICEGYHYLALVVDRAAGEAISFLDGCRTGTVGLPDDWAFVTPEGHDHARFLLFGGEDDATRNSYRAAARGTHIDAVRVQRRALLDAEISDTWLNMQDGAATPFFDSILVAVIETSSTTAVVNQCVVLSAANSNAGGVESITQYEWKVDDGAFGAGDPNLELSFDSPGDHQVTLRVTNSAAETVTNSARFTVIDIPVIAACRIELEGQELRGDPIPVAAGSILQLDATGSRSEVPAGAFLCDGSPLDPPAITSYRWDLDGDGNADDDRPAFDFGPLTTPGELTITLEVTNATGQTGSVSRVIEVAESGDNPLVFRNTPDTVLHLEFNDLPLGPVGDGAVIPDLSGQDLDLTIVDPLGDAIIAGAGAPQLNDNGALAFVSDPHNSGPRGVVLDDGDAFEMGPDDDFTFEIYVKASGNTQPQWGDIAGTFKARTDGTEESARYGWGIIKSGVDAPGFPGYNWIQSYQLGLSENELQVPFQLEAGLYTYVACVVDRLAQISSVYVNGELAGEVNLDPTWSFETPDGFPHAPFYLFTREQVTGQFSNCPSGTAVDALRFQVRALEPEEVADNWDAIRQGRGADLGLGPLQAVLTASPSQVIVGQCVRLSAVASTGGVGTPITEHRWRIDGGLFTSGDPVRDVSFDSPGIHQVTLRVTSARGSDDDTAEVMVEGLDATARIATLLDGTELRGDPVIVSVGTQLTLDGTASSSEVPVTAARCDGSPIAPPEITEYAWDVGDDGSVESTDAIYVTDPLAGPAELQVRLTARNAVGGEGTATITVRVADPQGNSRVFHSTENTILHLEFNGLAAGEVPEGTVVSDLSGNGLDLTIFDPANPVVDPPIPDDVDRIESVNGAMHFADNGALAFVSNPHVNGARGEVLNDGGAFEMGVDDDFTFEIYMKASDITQPLWGDVAGTFKARTDGTDGSPRYGWGILKGVDTPGRVGFAWLTPNQTPNELQVPFDLQAGEFAYIACVVDRPGSRSAVYVNGELVGERLDIDPFWSFETPLGLPPAPFYLFTREQIDDQFSNCPSGTVVDALRLQSVALTAEEIAQNWEDISRGLGANPVDGEPEFVRGDSNADGSRNITDGVFIFSFLFTGGTPPPCADAADTSDQGSINITSGIYILNFLFLGGPEPPAPFPDCGADPTPEGTELGCESFPPCEG